MRRAIPAAPSTKATPGQAAAIRIVRAHAEAGNHAAVLQSARALRVRKQDGYYVGEAYQIEVKTLLAMQDPKQAAAVVKAFLAQGNALVALDWIRDGELTSLVQTRHSAEMTGQPVTPYVDNLVLEVDGGRGDIADLVAGT